MASTRVYWDACAWIAYIMKENELDGGGVSRFLRCKNVLDAAAKGKIEIVTSTFTLAEVCKISGIKKGSNVAHLPSFFDQSFIFLVSIDKEIGLLAQSIQQGGISIKPADAIHAASACISDSEELHTFDDGLLKLDQKLNIKSGNSLKICHPA